MELPSKHRNSVAIVIPMYNEEIGIITNLKEIIRIISSFEKSLNVIFRLICVDDGSQDSTSTQVRDFCSKQQECELLCLTKNFGKEGAIEAGLIQAKDFDAVVVMDSDLQHPPEMIQQMIKLWREGIDVVEGVKVERGSEPWQYRQLTKIFYRVFGRFSGIDLKDRSDFKLLDSKVVHAYLGLKEKNRFFRGLIQWMGYPTAQIPFVVPLRKNGKTRWSFLKLFRLSVTAITTFSSAPLQVVTLLGIVTFLISLFLGVYSLALKVFGYAMDGFTTVIILLLFIGSVLMFSMGLLGMYMAQIFNEIKGRPAFLINDKTSYTVKNESYQVLANYDSK